MVLDFGLLKNEVKEFIESFDHAYSMWGRETILFKDAIKSFSERWVELPVSPSAEMYSLMFFYVIDEIFKNTTFNNGEKNVSLHSVRVHETATGYAESFREDLKYWDYYLRDIIFSDGIKDDWKNKIWWNQLLSKTKFINPKIKLLYEKK
jgi:6-pyruvoyltetrahydropterin/6-carboxytetrahydropterin synthase